MGFIVSFFEFMYDMLSDMFTSGWLGVIVGTIFVLVILFIVGLILWGLFIAVDSWFMLRQQQRGVITGKDYTPAHTIMMPITTTVGNVTTTTVIPQYIPDSWDVHVTIDDGRSDWMGVSQDYHNRVERGTRVTAEFVSGRLSRNIYLKALS